MSELKESYLARKTSANFPLPKDFPIENYLIILLFFEGTFSSFCGDEGDFKLIEAGEYGIGLDSGWILVYLVYLLYLNSLKSL